jgi:hypothetical protein
MQRAEKQARSPEVALDINHSPPHTPHGNMAAQAQPDATRRAISALGFDPPVDEVRTLAAAHNTHGLLTSRDEDMPLVTALADALTAKRGADAYSVLCKLRRHGGALGRALDLLERIYPAGVVLEFRAIGAGGGSHNWQVGADRADALAFLREHDGLRNLYVCPNPRRAELSGTDKPGNGNDVASRHFVVFDLDLKDAPKGPSDPDFQWQQTVARLNSLNPCVVVSTGNGFHFWFRIEPVTDPAEIAAMTAPLNNTMHAIGSDRVGDPPRPMRLPLTINVPTKNKRQRGNTLALAHVLGEPDPNAKVKSWQGLIHDIETAFGLDPDNLPGKPSSGTGQGGGSASTDAMPAEMLRAPSADALTTLLDLLPNNDDVPRDYYVRVAHAVRGASDGTDFKTEAKDAFLRWADRYPYSDPAEDERTYDTVRETHRGWPHLMADLRAANPAAGHLLTDRLAPARAAAARRAFEGVPFSPSQQHLVPPPANDNAGGADGAPLPAGPGDQAPTDPKQGKKGGTAAQRAVDALRAAGVELFQSPNGRTWAALAGRVYSLNSDAGLRALLGWLLVHADIAVTGTAKNELEELLEARAYVGPTRVVHYRQGQDTNPKKPTAFINLMDGQGGGVVVDGSGWRETPTAAMPVRFTDREGALPLPRPVRASDGVGFLDRLGRHIVLHPIQNPQSAGDAGIQQRAALLLFLLNQFYRAGTAAHLFLNGPQGAGKTGTGKRLKGLTDPDTVMAMLNLPSDEATVFAIAQQQTLLVLDNVSSMKGDAADLFCGLATGAAQQRRALYTNADRHISDAKASVVFTSIREDLIQRPDLMDRTVAVNLLAMDRKNRRTEAELDAAWEQDLPQLFAGLLDALSGALARLDAVRASTKPGDLPRLTDAALLAEAGAQGLGWPAGVCLAAINASQHSVNDRQLEENPYAFRVRALLEAEGDDWTGTAGELQSKLRFMDGPEWGRANQSLQSFMGMRDRMAGPLRETWGIHTAPTWKGPKGVRLMRLHRPAGVKQ